MDGMWTTMQPGLSPAPEPLALTNGDCAPLSDLPVFSFDLFRHWLINRVQDGCRISAFFALPENIFPNADPASPFRIVVILASNRDGRLYLSSCRMGRSYPSLTRAIPQLHLFERELYEKHGILPQDHPWLKPVRFEKADGPEAGDMDFYRVEGDDVHEVAVGPIHAGVIECGHFRFQCLGEVVMHLEISLGYHHRGVENLLLGGPDRRTLSLMEALAGDTTIGHSWAYCTLVESLTGTPPSPRGQIIRSLALELERLANHTGDLGALAGDVGFLPTQSFCGRLRGDWLNMSAMLCGSRFGRGLVTPGGAAFDLDADLLHELRARITAVARDVEGAAKVMRDSPSVINRFVGTGAVSREQASAVGLVGMAARACGLPIDARTSHPLPGLPAPAPVETLPWGDCLARAKLRRMEIERSVAYCLKLLNGCLADQGEDKNGPSPCRPLEIFDRAGQSLLRPGHLAVSLVEGWRGELCHTAVTGPDGRFAAYNVVDPSFHNWMGLALALREEEISDFPLCNKSFNLSYCGHDL